MKIKYYLSQRNNTISLHCKSPSISEYYVSQLWQSTVGSYTQIICYLFICVALLLIPIFVGWSLIIGQSLVIGQSLIISLSLPLWTLPKLVITCIIYPSVICKIIVTI